MNPVMCFPNGRMLWLGCKLAAHDQRFLKSNEIAARWCVMDGHQLWGCQGFEDMETTNSNQLTEGKIPPEHLLEQIAELWKRLKTKSVLVHCLRGANRSPLMVLLFLYMLTSEPWATLYDYLWKIRPIVDLQRPAPGHKVTPTDLFNKMAPELRELADELGMPLMKLPRVMSKVDFARFAIANFPTAPEQ